LAGVRTDGAILVRNPEVGSTVMTAGGVGAENEVDVEAVPVKM
jgi:hypothetical protein